MKSNVSAAPNGAALHQFFQFQGKLTPAAARALLKFGFSEYDHARMEELSTKAGAGALTLPEQMELDAYERLDCVLGVIHSRARQALQKKPQRLLNGMNQALADSACWSSRHGGNTDAF